MSSAPLAITYIAFLSAAGFMTWMFGYAARALAVGIGAIDSPETAPKRKVHARPVPLLGGVAVFVSIVTSLLIARGLDVPFIESAIKVKHLVGIGTAGLVLMLGGVFDDVLGLRPSRQIIAPIIATIIVVASGVGINYITNPFGGQIRLDTFEQIVFWFGGWPYKITLIADLFTIMWLMGMMYTTKFLDGLDGLVSGITVIGAVIIGLLSLDPVVAQPQTALFAFIVAGAFAGMLFWNWHPAKMFLGEGGSLFAGFILGVLAILSGSKVATTVLILGIPLLDLVWVILRRLLSGRSPFIADRKHLHFRLLDIGLSHRQAVLTLYFFTAYFGITALFLQSRGKLISLGILTASMALLGVLLVRRRQILYKKNRE